MTGIIKNLENHQSATPSRWREKATYRQENKEWLHYSQHVAMLMLDKMEQLHLTQGGLAELMGCSQQYVSRVLKGHENLTIDTIFKIEKVLDLDSRLCL